MPSVTRLIQDCAVWIFDVTVDDDHQFVRTTHACVTSLRTRRHAAGAGPQLGQGEYERGQCSGVDANIGPSMTAGCDSPIPVSTPSVVESARLWSAAIRLVGRVLGVEPA